MMHNFAKVDILKIYFIKKFIIKILIVILIVKVILSYNGNMHICLIYSEKEEIININRLKRLMI